MTRASRGALGLTLIEILLILAILGILFALAYPALNRFVQTSRFQQSVRVFEEGLVSARDIATRQSTPVRLVADGDTVAWFDATSGALMSSRSLPFGTRHEGSAAEVLFSGRGLPITQARFDLRRNDDAASVFLLPTGAIVR